jgi:cation diffusion facilitator CzcD-associated flavoprotein CzcO
VEDGSANEIDVAIIGAGFGGIGAAIRLQLDNVLVFDRGDVVGGTWRDNIYRVCACDVPSHLYSFSFARNPSWSDTFSGQAEICEYLRDCVTRYGLSSRLRLATPSMRPPGTTTRSAGSCPPRGAPTSHAS